MEAANYKHFAGIDVSKDKIDISLILDNNKQNHQHHVFSQSKKGFEQMYKWFKQATGDNLSALMVCVENTGLYGEPVVLYLVEKEVFVNVENAYNIKRSVRDNRTKNDKLDSRNIAVYAMLHKTELRQYEQPSEQLHLLQQYITKRSQLVKVRKMLEQADKEAKEFSWGLPVLAAPNTIAIEGIKKQLEEIERKIAAIIKADKELSRLFGLITSVPAVGKITAYHFICYTNAFKTIGNGKQLASYCGVVPFEHSSGSSVRKRSRVSMHANKILKWLLHLCAITATKMKNKLSSYYQRKRQEGKMPMVAINALRNKIVLTIAAVVRNGVPYNEDHQYNINNLVKP